MNILTLIADTRQSLSQASAATRPAAEAEMIPRRRANPVSLPLPSLPNTPPPA